MSIAFASILQARPGPTFGRPVHLRGSPLDYGPVLLLMPFRFHLTVDTLPSEVPQMVASGQPWSVSGFRLRARLGLSIPATSPASDVLSPLLDIAPLIRAPEGLEPSRSTRCSAQSTLQLTA